MEIQVKVSRNVASACQVYCLFWLVVQIWISQLASTAETKAVQSARRLGLLGPERLAHGTAGENQSFFWKAKLNNFCQDNGTESLIFPLKSKFPMACIQFRSQAALSFAQTDVNRKLRSFSLRDLDLSTCLSSFLYIKSHSPRYHTRQRINRPLVHSIWHVPRPPRKSLPDLWWPKFGRLHPSPGPEHCYPPSIPAVWWKRPKPLLIQTVFTLIWFTRKPLEISTFSTPETNLFRSQKNENSWANKVTVLGIVDLRHDHGGNVVHRHCQGPRKQARQEAPD